MVTVINCYMAATFKGVFSYHSEYDSVTSKPLI